MPHQDRLTFNAEEIAAILDQAQVCRLALSDGERPYVVPLCFARQEQRIYLHSAAKGRKIDLLKRNPRVCIEVDRLLGLKPGESACSFGLYYESVVGFGTAIVVQDETEKRTALELLCRRYGVPGQMAFSDKALAGTMVLRVEFDQISAKRSR